MVGGFQSPESQSKLCGDATTLRGDVIETYKLLTGKYNWIPEDFFERSHGNWIRGHYQLTKKRSAHPAIKKFFFLLLFSVPLEGTS